MPGLCWGAAWVGLACTARLLHPDISSRKFQTPSLKFPDSRANHGEFPHLFWAMQQFAPVMRNPSETLEANKTAVRPLGFAFFQHRTPVPHQQAPESNPKPPRVRQKPPDVSTDLACLAMPHSAFLIECMPGPMVYAYFASTKRPPSERPPANVNGRGVTAAWPGQCPRSLHRIRPVCSSL